MAADFVKTRSISKIYRADLIVFAVAFLTTQFERPTLRRDETTKLALAYRERDAFRGVESGEASSGRSSTKHEDRDSPELRE